MKMRELPNDFIGWIRHEGVFYLVGDVNQLGGVCDDCQRIEYEDTIEIISTIERMTE